MTSRRSFTGIDPRLPLSKALKASLHSEKDEVHDNI